MADNTKISWCDASLALVTGCTPAGEGCQHCYAKRMFHRLASMPNSPKYRGREFCDVQCHEDELVKPLRWKMPRSIFISPMGDLFHKDVPFQFVARLWWVMGQCAGYLDPSRTRGHEFIILTKRPDRMREFFDGWADDETRRGWIENLGEMYDWMSGPKYWPEVFPNVVLGVSCSTQAEVDQWLPVLLGTPAARRVVSLEPLVGPVSLRRGPATFDLDGVIVGGESGPGARPMHAEWVRDLRDECAAAGVPFMLKQWGDALNGMQILGSRRAELTSGGWSPHEPHGGRVLDGRTHDALCWEVRS